jgi:hypothetical protein
MRNGNVLIGPFQNASTNPALRFLLLHLSPPVIKQFRTHPQLLDDIADPVSFVAYPHRPNLEFLDVGFSCRSHLAMTIDG